MIFGQAASSQSSTGDDGRPIGSRRLSIEPPPLAESSLLYRRIAEPLATSGAVGSVGRYLVSNGQILGLGLISALALVGTGTYPLDDFV
jgi:hypothetical protein